ncbi:MAG: agmatinase [Patescibacteria group bacterium]
MTKRYNLWPFNFGALLGQNFSAAKVVIVPMPYEGAASFQTGTSAGPYAIITSSRYLDEVLDHQGKTVGFEPTDIYTLDEVDVPKDTIKGALESIQAAIDQEVLRHGKIPLMLGGDHSISLGAVRAVKKKYPDLSVLHFDAHLDTYNTYEGTRYSHACVIKRILDLNIPVVSLGIRRTEPTDIGNSHHVYRAPALPSGEKALSGLTKHVYCTFDVDCLDPSIMPSVGTPLPDGLRWAETIEFLERISKKIRFVGADVVELKPIPGFEAPNFLAAKLVYQLALNILRKK